MWWRELGAYVAHHVGCRHQLNDPYYIGWWHPCITGEAYFSFTGMFIAFIATVKRRWPDVPVQFEDFAQHTAMPLLQSYHDELCCFNDDI